MRKTALIVIGLFCCLLASAGHLGGAVACVPAQAEILSIDHAGNDEWLCERVYNSDLNLLRVGGEMAVPSASSVSLRVAESNSGRLFARLLAAQHDAGPFIPNRYFHLVQFAAGPHAVDYYVYCLRRLII